VVVVYLIFWNVCEPLEYFHRRMLSYFVVYHATLGIL
jgi:hypothetical protein